MSKADIMFEELGYSNENQMSDDIILYEKPDYSYNEEQNIIFYLDDKSILKRQYNWENDKTYPSEISLQELQAINEKCKELRWL